MNSEENNINDELGCTISYKQNEIDKPNFTVKSSNWQRCSRRKTKQKCNTFLKNILGH